MKQLVYKITDEQGIHARPAGELVKIAKAFSSEIKISKGENVVDCKKIFGVMSIGAKKDDVVNLSFSGEDEEQALNAVEEFMKSNL